jgi:uncharacterized protein (TIRG00374 family)
VKRLLLMVLLSFTLGFLGLYLVSREALLDPASYLPVDLGASPVVVGLLSFGLMWIIPYRRLQLLAQQHHYRLSPYTAWLAHIAMVFGAALTPGGSGGAPTLVAALTRLGIPIGTGIGMAVQIFILDLVVFAWLIPLGLFYAIFSETLVLPGKLELLSLLAALVALVGALMLGRYPRPIVRLMLSLARRRSLRRWATRLRQAARSYYRSARAFAAMRLREWVWLQLVTLLGWLANFTLFWALLTIYGSQVRLLDIIVLLSVITLISFVIPTPGAAGFMEFVVGLAAGGHVAQPIAAPILIWRLGSFYLTFVLGPLAGWLLLLHKPPRWLQHWWQRRRRAGD